MLGVQPRVRTSVHPTKRSLITRSNGFPRYNVYLAFRPFECLCQTFWFILLRSEIPSGKCAKLRTVAASNNRVHMPWSLYHCLFAPHICMVLFFTHIPFVVNPTINATPPERLQQYRPKTNFWLSNFYVILQSSCHSFLHYLFWWFAPDLLSHLNIAIISFFTYFGGMPPFCLVTFTLQNNTCMARSPSRKYVGHTHIK